LAMLSGRDYVTPDDVQAVAPAALRHRVVVAPELALDGMRADDVLDDLITKVEAPRS
jgi:MoxR-like ATPase